MARDNFYYYRYQFDGKEWNRLARGTLYTRAHTLKGIARAVKSINCPISVDRDVIVAYSFPENVKQDERVSIVWCPAIDYQEAFECYQGESSQEYNKAVTRCLMFVERNLTEC